MWTITDSPVGPLGVVSQGGAITAIEFTEQDPGVRPTSSTGRSVRVAADRVRGDRDDRDPLLREARAQLAAYFERGLKEFDLPLAPEGTAFQHRVWAELRSIGYGETASYGDIAARLGMTNAASRAVGLATGRNPVPIVVACHRVVGADGSLTGYAGGVSRKQLLLDLEQEALFTVP